MNWTVNIEHSSMIKCLLVLLIIYWIFCIVIFIIFLSLWMVRLIFLLHICSVSHDNWTERIHVPRNMDIHLTLNTPAASLFVAMIFIIMINVYCVYCVIFTRNIYKCHPELSDWSSDGAPVVCCLNKFVQAMLMQNVLSKLSNVDYK